MKKRKWNSGPPPHVGWWRCKDTLMESQSEAWRWWNGKLWSWSCYSYTPLSVVANFALNSETGIPIRWCEDYPSDARVPRIAP